MTEMTGSYGTASRVPPENFKDHPPAAAQLDTWIVTAPCWHPLWSQYMIGVVSLAAFPGMDPAVKDYSEATHELDVIALNPDYGPYTAEEITPENPVKYMLPINIVIQFIATDEQAAEICHGLTHMVVEGALCPETGGSPSRVRESWEQVLARTLDHFRDPHHGQMN